MSGRKELMNGLDAAAAELLRRHFPKEDPDEPRLTTSDPEIQIKAFTACVNWYGPRTKLGGDDEGKTNEFTRLKDRLHGHRKARSRPSDIQAEAVNGAANGAADGATTVGVPQPGEPS
jgi:hypothetical protein